jgi:hypothetical protein
MKYWNRNKRIRQEHWTRVERPMHKYRGFCRYSDIKRELQNYPGDGKFYMYFGSDAIWFEREEDAIMFVLKYL